MAVFVNQTGNQQHRGTAAQYDQVDYTGALADYSFAQNANGTVTVVHPTLGTDTLTSIEGFWFSGEAAWYSMADAMRLAGGDDVDGFIDTNGTVTGNTGNNRLTGQNQNDVFYGDRGNDIINGNGGNYNQVEYDGALNEYTFTQNSNGSVTVSHATWGTDTLTDIDGIWFTREQAWYSVEDAISASEGQPTFRLDDDNVLNGTPGNDRMTGDSADDSFYGGTGNDTYNGRGGYNQVNFDGDLSDYTVTQNNNGSFTFDHPVWGTDTLTNIDGLWFNGESEWYAVDEGLLA